MTLAPDVAAACRALIDGSAALRLSTRVTHQGSRALTIADGYVPLLVDYTAEDRAAKGLRRLEANPGPRPAVHDSVLEALAGERLLLLTGASGCGKSTSLLHVALHLAGASIDDPRWTLAGLERPVPRNEEGTLEVERWSAPVVPPVLVVAESPMTLARLLGGASVADPCLLMIDRAERLGALGPLLLRELAQLARSHAGLRVVVAGDVAVCRAWAVPTAFARRRIVPLVAAQRRAIRALVRPDDEVGDAASYGPDVLGNAGLYTLATEGAIAVSSSIDVIDRWLYDAAQRHARPVDALVEPGRAVDEATEHWLQRPFVQRQLAARAWRHLPLDTVGERYRADPLNGSGTVELLAQRFVRDGLPMDPLLLALTAGDGDASAIGAIDAARIADRPWMTPVGTAVATTIGRALRAIVEGGRLPPALREEAGRALAARGDPRDLDALVPIAGGPFTMGSTAHPNSAPPHAVTLAAFRIGRYPVTNRLYLRFVGRDRSRPWRSGDGRRPGRAGAPAVDLTWHDARACCAWLTTQWRRDGRIGSHETVRLPTEPEWERAARGLDDRDGLIYPWPGAWEDDRANSEEVGFNDTCTVGLFPAGRSAAGCDDLAGQVWEWTSTLWGEDMATPRFAYPYADDGREDPEAPGNVRRVLRGACFLSPREKANCTYRGSLEPDGWWRGNGFRVVVS